MQLKFNRRALDDWHWWKKNDKNIAEKIARLLDETLLAPYSGTGKPEKLKHSLAGCWSRRINREHRLVYKVEGDNVVILSCRYHYD